MPDYPHDKRAASLDRLRTALGYKPLRRSWAKCEILLGLLAVGIAAPLMTSSEWGLLLDSHVYPQVVGIALFVLGGYLAMAGHRSHLYQSNSELASYLADLIEKRSSTFQERSSP